MMSSKAIMLLAAALISSAALLQGCGGDGGDTTTTTTPSSSSIPAIAEKTKELSTLVEALKAADLVSVLEGAGPFTVFAPTNDAFAALPSATLTYLLNTKDKLTEVLEYHVANGDLTSGDLKNETLKMLAGGNTSITVTNSSVMINNATVTTADVKASNGVVHIINKVLIPPTFTAPTIPELATSANLTTLVQAVTAGQLATNLSGSGPFTVFAPTNGAFDALPAGVLTALLLPANLKSLQQVLEYHVHSGEVVSKDLKSGEQVDTLEGSKLNITIVDSKVEVNNANVTKADQFAINGVVHEIDAVLLPPGWTPPNSTIAAKILV